MKNLFKDKKWWKDTFIFLCIGIVINVFCFFVCSFTGHCENSIKRLPYDYTWNTTSLSESDINNMLTNASAYIDISNPNVVIFWGEISDSSWLYNYVVAVVDSVTLPQNSTFESVNLASDSVIFHFSESYIGQTDLSSYWADGNQLYAPTQTIFFGSSATIVHPVDFPYSETYRFMPLWGTVTLNNQIYIGTHFSDIDVGEFIDLPSIDNILDNIQNTWEPPSTTTGHALPTTPQENTNNTPFQDRLQMFQYLADTITQNFGNFGYNLQNFFNKIQQKLTDVANSISQNIYNGFKTLLDNVKDFFGPKLDKIIDLLSQLQNNATSDFEENWEDSQVKQDFDSISQSVETSFTVWSNTYEPNEFKIPLHVENVTILHCNQVQYIDLGLFSPVLPYIRTIMWALMVYSLVYTIIDSLANYITGGDE